MLLMRVAVFWVVSGVCGRRPWSTEFVHEGYVCEDNEGHYYRPWHCCQMCGLGDAWQNYVFNEGRCRLRSEHPNVTADDLHDYAFLPVAHDAHQCCHWCGDAPGLYEYKEERYNGHLHMYCGRVRPQSQADIPNLALFTTNSDGLKCVACHLLINVIQQGIMTVPDLAADQLVLFCDELFLLKSTCKSIIHHSLATIKELLRNHTSPDAICGAIHLCAESTSLIAQDISALISFKHGWDMLALSGGDHTQALLHTTLLLPAVSRFSILPPNEEPLLALDMLNLDMTMADLGLEFATEDAALVWLARYGLISNSRECPRAVGAQNCAARMSLVARKGQRQAARAQQAGQAAVNRAIANRGQPIRGRGRARGQGPRGARARGGAAGGQGAGAAAAGGQGQAAAAGGGVAAGAQAGGAAQAAAAQQGGGGYADKYIWRCPDCRREHNIFITRSVREGSFFSKSHLSLQQIMKVLIWSTNPTALLDTVKHETGCDKKTLVDWYNFIRDVCQQWVEDHQTIERLGGPNTVVEIDESLLYRAKYNIGQALVRQHTWVFGMVERGTNKVRIFPVQDRTAATLIPLIAEHVAPGTTVVSDGWRAYGGIAAMVQAFNHRVVNHNVNFVDPQDPAVHTQTIEATWSSLKNSLRHLHSTSEELFPTYLYQYIFRRYHDNQKIFQHLLFWIRHYNPVPD